MARRYFSTTSIVTLACAIFNPTTAAPAQNLRSQPRATSDPFAILDEQKWVNPDNMTWSDFIAPPGTHWSDPTHKGRDRNFNIAMVTVDYSDQPFVVTLPANSDIFGNPQPSAAGLKREDVPKFYHDHLNVPGGLNGGHTLHEYWMGDSFGKYGVNLTVFGPYRLPGLSYQYGIDAERGGMNEGDCPSGPPCTLDLRTDAFAAWRADVGNQTASAFELAFILSAGQDESSTWQEFGEMKFSSPSDIPDSFGPPGNSSMSNAAHTRYVDWTSWAAASKIWPNAGSGSSTQGESSGMSTFAHELSHLLGIGDNYNNPYSDPPRRAYTGPYSMLDRGTFNGPGGPHSRWQIPATQGSTMGSLHTMRDKHQIALIDNSPILQISRSALAASGPVVAEITARCIDPASTASGLMGFNITLDGGGDKSPHCNISTDALCDGGSYDNYNVEVVDRMGADSFCPDHGVMISKTMNSDARQPFQWVVDANPQDTRVVDFYYPNGTARYWSIGDYRQLVDALFHAGTRSGSLFEHVDEANGLHLYVLDVKRGEGGELSYTVGVRSTTVSNSSNSYGVELSPGIAAPPFSNSSNSTWVATTCSFNLTNTGTAGTSNTTSLHPQDLSTFLGSDIYKLSAAVEGEGVGEGWRVEVPNALAHAKFGASTEVKVAVGRARNGTTTYSAAAAAREDAVVVRLTAVSQSGRNVTGRAGCRVSL